MNCVYDAKKAENVLDRARRVDGARSGVRTRDSWQTMNSANKAITVRAQAIFEQGLAMHQRGSLIQAQEIYGQVLALQPDHFDALHLLGVVNYQRGRSLQAVELIGRAIDRNPDVADAYSNRGLALHELKRFDEALDSYNRAIRIRPDYAEAHSNRGNALRELRRFDEALDSYDRALRIRPDYAEAHNNRGNALQGLERFAEALDSYELSFKFKPGHAVAYHNHGNALQRLERFDEALVSYERALELKPDYAEAYNNRGLALQELRRFDLALDSYDRALLLKPDFAEAYNNRGNALKELNMIHEALESYDRALQLNPDFAEAYYNRGLALQELNMLDEALSSYNRAVELEPDFARAHSNRGLALQELKRFDEALNCHDLVLELRPDDAEAYNNRGLVLKDLKRIEEALDSSDHAIRLKPDFAEAYGNRGNALQELKRFDEALDSYDRALELKPDCAEAHWNLSLCRLLMGDFAPGWEGFEWRWQCKRVARLLGGKRNFTQPLWLGAESLKGKTILLHSEGGLGDTIQFCRYAKSVSDLGAHVILEVPKPLLSLLSNLEGIAQAVEKSGTPPAFDYHCPLMSLPLAFKTDLSNIPSASHYIESDRERVAQWEARLGKRATARIGLVWSGSTINRNRSIALHDVIERLPKHYQYVSLQKETSESDKKTLEKSRNHILCFDEHLKDFADTAALCRLVDLVISVDTSVAHLAGALGKAVWILLPFMPDWRWLLDRQDSPWYASARLFRQNQADDWSTVLDQIQTALPRQFGKSI